MTKEKTKVYIYTRVSTAMQIDGYSLEAQRSRMKAFAQFNDFAIIFEQYVGTALQDHKEPGLLWQNRIWWKKDREGSWHSQ